MKFFTIIAVFAFASVASAAFTKNNPDVLLRFRNECVAELKISKELENKYDNFDFPDEELTHNYIKCCALKYGTWNEKDGFVPEYMLIQFGQNKKDIVAKCKTTRNPEWTSAKWVWNNWNCLVANGILKD